MQPKLDRYRSFHHDHYYHHYHLLKSTNLKFEFKSFKCVLVKYEFDEDNLYFCFIIEGKFWGKNITWLLNNWAHKRSAKKSGIEGKLNDFLQFCHIFWHTLLKMTKMTKWKLQTKQSSSSYIYNIQKYISICFVRAWFTTFWKVFGKRFFSPYSIHHEVDTKMKKTNLHKSPFLKNPLWTKKKRKIVP